MTLGQTLRKSYRDLWESWTRLADTAFGGPGSGRQDDMSRGEFTSAFITERDLTFPTPRSRRDQPNG